MNFSSFLEVETEEDLKYALEHDKKSIGHRYIEVFKVRRVEMDWVLKRIKPSIDQGSGYDKKDMISDCDTFVRLRGLPFECTKEDIVNFFEGTTLSF